MAKILVVDDEITMIQMISELLRSEGHEPFSCSNFQTALVLLERECPDLVVTDLFLEKAKPMGLALLAKARAMHPPAAVLVITGFATVETAVEAMRQGAFEYLQKPFKVDEFRLAVSRALAFNQALSENAYLRKQLGTKYHFDQLVGTSPPMQKVLTMVERVADNDSTILILGESGTGKELIARALHFNSRRQFAPFIPINCSALPESLLESELFGHRKGSFTGAIGDKKGLFEEADGGTIFLDEIGSMPALLQSRLLRVLQEREVRRVGENISIRVNVRVLAATNESLETRIKEGTFREDLYYRLNVIPICLPPLRERRDDIPLIAAHFLRNRVHPRTGKPFQVSRQAMHGLTVYDWPGNVRELQNVIERTCALADSEVITLETLPPAIIIAATESPATAEMHATDTTMFTLPADATPVRNGNPPSIPAPEPETVADLKTFMRQQELAYINRALKKTEGDKEKAATLLGISMATMYRRLSEE